MLLQVIALAAVLFCAAGAPALGQATASIQVAWTSDYTTMPPQQVCSSGGTVAGPFMKIHVHLSFAPMLTTPTSVLVTEDAGGVHTVTPVELVGQVTTGPCPPGCTQNPNTTHYDATWSSPGFHNRPHVVHVAGLYWTPGFPMPLGPFPYSGDATFTLGNLVIESTTPANPEPILWQGDPEHPVALSVTLSSAYRAMQSPRLRIYPSDQSGNPIRTETLTPEAVGPGPATRTFVWNGSKDTPPGGTAQKGVYLFMWDVGPTPQMESDCDKSGHLTLTSAGGEAQGSWNVDDCAVQVTYTLGDTLNQPGNTGHIDVYDPELVLRSTTALTVDDLTLGQHTVGVPAPTMDTAGEYVFLVSVNDRHGNSDKAHRERWALQCNQKRTVPYTRGTGNTLQALADPNGPLPCVVTIAVNREAVFSETINDRMERTVVFDTTHFAHLTPLAVTYRLAPAGGTPVQTFISAIAYNRAYVLGNRVLDSAPLAVSAVSGTMGGINHQATPSTTDPKQTILTGIKDYTVFYSYTHGNAGLFVDCIDTGVITAAEVSAACAAKRLPDNKPALWIPEYEFVFIDACLTASTPALADAFHVNHPPPSDEAFLGWKTKVNGDRTTVLWSKQVFLGLAKGMTLAKARAEATKRHKPQYRDDNGRLQPAVARTYGDPFTKVHGVFRGKGLEWHTVLP